MSKVISSKNASFEIEVPYEFIEVGEEGVRKPLMVYLHGYNQNAEAFRKKVNYLTAFEGYHLFINAPYIVFDHSRKRKVPQWGRSWYLYDGTQEQFVSSLEKSSVFLQKIIEEVAKGYAIDRTCLVGYSMGGYLAGYFTLSRSSNITEAIIIGARIKTEVFEDRLGESKHVSFLALHGANDTSVLPEPQKNEVIKLSSKGFDAEFIEVESGHELSEAFKEPIVFWLLKQGYKME